MILTVLFECYLENFRFNINYTMAALFLLLTIFVHIINIINVYATTKRPHIIFLMADQFRQDALGSIPGSLSFTPNLNIISGEGLTFYHSFTSTPSCTPARAAILTGRSPWGHGMLGYGAVSMNYSYVDTSIHKIKIDDYH